MAPGTFSSAAASTFAATSLASGSRCGRAAAVAWLGVELDPEEPPSVAFASAAPPSARALSAASVRAVLRMRVRIGWISLRRLEPSSAARLGIGRGFAEKALGGPALQPGPRCARIPVEGGRER